MISLPAVTSSPILGARSGAGPSKPAAQLDQILLCGQDEIRPQLTGPTFQRPNILSRVGVMIGEDADVEQPTAQWEQGPPKSFRVANPAKRRDRPTRDQVDG